MSWAGETAEDGALGTPGISSLVISLFIRLVGDCGRVAEAGRARGEEDMIGKGGTGGVQGDVSITAFVLHCRGKEQETVKRKVISYLTLM